MQGGGGTALNRISASLRGAIATKQSSDPQGRQCSSGVCHWLTQLRCAGSPRRPKGLLVMTVGFTMAEILLSLTIIGVVAAITLPSLTGNINERTWNTQRKALYARMSQAISLMPAMNGYGVLEDGDPNNVAETFVTAGLAKVLKINNICDSEHLSDCGVPDKLITMTGAQIDVDTIKTLGSYNSLMVSYYSSGTTYSYNQTDTKAAAFETANGESVMAYYNPSCQGQFNVPVSYVNADYTQPRMCANFIYDLNGKKGPNTLGKDIGVMSVLYNSDSAVVAPKIVKLGGREALYREEALKFCKSASEDARLANLEETVSVFYNKKLFDEILGDSYWAGGMTTTVASTGAKSPISIAMYSGMLAIPAGDSSGKYNLGVVCVTR